MNKSVVSQMEKANRDIGSDFNASILRDIREYHTDVADIAMLARDAGVKRLALTHLAPPIAGDARVRVVLVHPIPAGYKGEVIFGPDGMRAVVPID